MSRSIDNFFTLNHLKIAPFILTYYICPKLHEICNFLLEQITVRKTDCVDGSSVHYSLYIITVNFSTTLNDPTTQLNY